MQEKKKQTQETLDDMFTSIKCLRDAELHGSLCKLIPRRGGSE